MPFDKGIKGGGSPINGTINGVEDENSLIDRIGDRDEESSKGPSDDSYLEPEAKSLVNGQQIAPKLEYDSVKVPGGDNEKNDPSGKKSRYGCLASISVSYLFCKLVTMLVDGAGSER